MRRSLPLLSLAPVLILAAVAACGPRPAATPDAGSADAPVVAQASAATPSPEALTAKAVTAEAFVPPGWRLEAQKSGDLNGDALPDMVLVLHGTDPAKVLKDVIAEDDGAPLDTNPRRLVVALAQPGGGYRLAAENSTLIPPRDQPNAEDYFDSVEIANGTLHVGLRVFMSSGGWGVSTMKFTFRWRNEHLELIGYDRNDFQRNTHDYSDVSVNYLSGRKETSQGNDDSGDPGKSAWSPLPKRPLLTIDQVGNGLDFDPAA